MGDLPNTPTQQTNTTDKQKPFKRGVNSSEKQKTYQQKNADGFLCVLKKKPVAVQQKKKNPPTVLNLFSILAFDVRSMG
jgi:hypothetical protein